MDNYKEDMDFDKVIREKSAKDYPYDPSLWAEASAMLDDEFGAASGKRVFKNWIYYLSGVVLLGIVVWFAAQKDSATADTTNRFELSSPLLALQPEIFGFTSMNHTSPVEQNVAQISNGSNTSMKQAEPTALNTQEEPSQDRQSIGASQDQQAHSNGNNLGDSKTSQSGLNSGGSKPFQEESSSLMKSSKRAQRKEKEAKEINKRNDAERPASTGAKQSESDVERNASLVVANPRPLGALPYSNQEVLKEVAHQSQLDQPSPTRRKLNFGLDLEYGFGVMGAQQLLDYRSPEWAADRTESERFKHAHHIQGKLTLSRNRWFGSLGLGYSSWTAYASYMGPEEEFVPSITYSRRILDGAFEKDGKQVILIQDVADTTYTTSTVIKEVYNGNATISYLQIPISLGYEMPIKRSFILGAELEGNLGLLPRIQGFQKLSIVYPDRPELSADLKRVQFSARPKVYFGYSITRNLVVRVGLHSNVGLTSLSNAYTWKLSSTGFQTGIRWTF